jgi:hypothetical protein
MFILNLNIQQCLMIISLPPSLLQFPNLPILQLPSNRNLKFFPTNLFPSLLLLRCLQLRLKPRLHPYPHRSIEGDRLCVTTNFRQRARFRAR